MSPDKKLKSSPQQFMLIFNYEVWLVKLGLEPAFSSISRTTLRRNSQTGLFAT